MVYSKTPQAALDFMNALVPAATAKAASEGKDIQAAIASQGAGFALEPWDWNFYAERVRKSKFDLDDAAVKRGLEDSSGRMQ